MLMPLTSRPDGLKFDPESGVLFAPRARVTPDENQPRKHFPAADLRELRISIDAVRETDGGLGKTGFDMPFLCRWEPGSLDGKGNPTKSSKLIIEDGERRWRATDESYPLIPLIIKNDSSQEAWDVALRSSLQKKLLTPLEEGNAFAARMKATGEGTYRTARHYGVSEGFLKNRVYLRDCPPDVQDMVNRHSDTMSHALAFRAAGSKLPAADRKELIQKVLSGMSLVALKEEIQERIAAHEFKSQSRQAPDAHTQSRQKQAAITGSAPVSRGKQVTATTPRDAKAEVETLVVEITGKIIALESFVDSVDQKYFREKVLPNVRRWQQTLDSISKKSK